MHFTHHWNAAEEEELLGALSAVDFNLHFIILSVGLVVLH